MPESETRAETSAGLALPPILLQPWQVWRALVIAILILLFLSTLGRLLLYYVPDFVMRDAFATTFDVDKEGSVPTLFSVLLHLGCSLSAGLVAAARYRARLPYLFRWFLITGLFVMTSMDEYLGAHERLIGPLRKMLDVSGAFHFAWVIPGMGLVVVLTAILGKVVLTLPPTIRNLVVLSAAVFLGGSLGMEMLGGAYIAGGGGFDSIGYVPYPLIEEAMEMFGTATFIYAMLRYLTEHFGSLELRLHGRGFRGSNRLP